MNYVFADGFKARSGEVQRVEHGTAKAFEVDVRFPDLSL